MKQQMKKEKREEEEEKESREEEEEVGLEEVWDCGSPLYDSYELATLGHLIDRHTMALPSPCGSYRFSFRVEKRVKTASFQGVSGAWWRWRRKQVRSGGKDKPKKKKKVKNGLFGFGRSVFEGPVC
uniref:Uncharacterized protein n=1 Tax=Kalanchoe fedtschenkoi TaxID=63787 RepID=A0A7N1A7M1_KALFE